MSNHIAALITHATQGKNITAAENRMLAYRVQAGDEKAKHEMVLRNLPFVLREMPWIMRHSPDNMPWDDVFCEAVVTLIQAVNAYDPSEFTFSTYLGRSLRRSVQKHLDKWDANGTAKSKSLAEARGYVNDKAAAFAMGLDQSHEAMAKRFGRTVEKTAQLALLADMLPAYSLDVLMPSDKEDDSYLDRLQDPRHTEEIVEALMGAEALRAGMGGLSDEQALVIRARFGERRTLQSVGKEMGKSRVEVRVIERDALNALAAQKSVSEAA